MARYTVFCIMFKIVFQKFQDYDCAAIAQPANQTETLYILTERHNPVL